MAKNSIRDFSATASSNTDIQSVDIDENCAASGINNAIRELMADLADVDSGTVALTSPQADNMTVTGTVTTDTIAENTSAAGVTIDGVLLKDGGVGSASAAIAAYLSSINGGQIGGNRNLIINGAMQVAQRGASASGIGNSDGGYHTLDRWAFRETNTPSFEFTWSQSTDAPDGFGYSMKVDVTTAEVTPVGYGYIQQRFEGQNLQQLKKGTSNAENVTLSFWVKSSKTGTYIVEIRDSDNSRHISKSYSVSSSNTWEHKTITFDGDTSGVLDNDNAESLRLNFWLVADTTFTSGTLATSWASITNSNRAVGQTNLMDSTSNDWYITGVQLEVGDTATPFEHRSYGDELARCQRYFEKTYADSVYFMNGSSGTQIQRQTNRFMVQKRASPTVTQTKTAGSSASTVGNVGANIDGIIHSFSGNNIDSCFFSWTADAEL